MRKIRILFMPLVDAASLNAQSLNLRETALRLDAARFELSLFYAKEPDPRLRSLSHIKLIRLPNHLKTLRLLKEMFSGYDIVAYVDYSPASYLFLHCPKIFRRSKTVMHAEGLSRIDDASWMLKFLYWGTTLKCDFHTGITECIARDFESVTHRKVTRILPIGVDRGLFSSTRDTISRSPTVLFVGTLIERKGLLLVLDAAARFPKTKFRIIGPDRDGFEQVVRKRIAEEGLSNAVLEGPKPQDAIAQAMQESDIFLLPSRIEGLPKVTLEAAASGLPCIVFRDYETPSVVDGVTGFQVATREEMIEKLSVLLLDPDLRNRMGSAARQLAQEFDWDKVSRKWEEAYLAIAASESR